jgi:hypothetical protein
MNELKGIDPLTRTDRKVMSALLYCPAGFATYARIEEISGAHENELFKSIGKLLVFKIIKAEYDVDGILVFDLMNRKDAKAIADAVIRRQSRTH